VVRLRRIDFISPPSSQQPESRLGIPNLNKLEPQTFKKLISTSIVANAYVSLRYKGVEKYFAHFAHN